MAPSNIPFYQKDEKVLCFHHELLYEAKVLDYRHTDENDKKSPYLYRVHYKGWKNTWDDWVPQDRIRKNSDENKELAANLKSELDRLTRPAKAPVPSTKKKAASSDLSSLRGSEERLTPVTGRGQKRGRDNEIEKVGDNPQEAQRPQRKKKKTAKAKALDPPKETNLPTKVLEKVVKPGPTAIKQEPKSRKRALGSPKEATPPSNGPENVAKSGPTAVKTRKAKALEPPKETIPHANASQKETKPGPPESTKEPKSRKRALEPDSNKERPPKKTRITRSSGPLPGADLRPRPAGYYVTAGVSLEPEANKLDNNQEDTFNNRPAVHIPTPDNLKSLLVDDWEFVTKNLTVVPLPSQYPVNKIIDTYFEEEKPKRRMGSADMDILHEVKAGLKDYFEKTLGRILLYRFERQQYLEVYLKMQANKGEFADKTIGDIYGPEHLARLLVSLPELIAQTNMDEQSVRKLRDEMIKVTNWLGKNSARFFTAEYEAVSQEYIEKVRGN